MHFDLLVFRAHKLNDTVLGFIIYKELPRMKRVLIDTVLGLPFYIFSWVFGLPLVVELGQRLKQVGVACIAV